LSDLLALLPIKCGPHVLENDWVLEQNVDCDMLNFFLLGGHVEAHKHGVVDEIKERFEHLQEFALDRQRGGVIKTSLLRVARNSEEVRLLEHVSYLNHKVLLDQRRLEVLAKDL